MSTAIEMPHAIAWSEQQAAFLKWCEDPNGGSCVLIAVAGAGKTTVLLEAGKRILGGVAYMAYNRKIVDETKAKLIKMEVDWRKVLPNTAHGFGLSAYRKLRPNVRVDGEKMNAILDDILQPRNPFEEPHPMQPHFNGIKQLVSLAKQHLIGILHPLKSFDAWADMADHYDVFDDEDGPVAMEEIVKVCIEALQRSIASMDVVDFDDMIYMPLYHRARFWKYDVVMVDEAQDTNAARRALIRAMLKKGGRVIAVGDPHQAIYGFTGADADSLDLIARDFGCVYLNLTVTFRCPKTVVTFAHQWVKHIVAAPQAPEGAVTATSMLDFVKRNDLTAGSAVLCRVTKPLVSLAFKLIRQRTPCRIEGRDVGKSIQKMMTRWKVKKLDALEDRLAGYLARETTKLLAKKQEAKLSQVEDMVETIRVIIDQCQREKKHDVSDAVEYVDQLFGDDVSNVLVLSTIHKSKGREWPNVFWLDRKGTCPSPWARQDWQQQQEKNLCYVAATRAQNQLIELEAA